MRKRYFGAKVWLLCFVICFFSVLPAAAAELYVTHEVSPYEQAVTVEHRPLITWHLISPVKPSLITLYLDGRQVPGAWNEAEKLLTYQPAQELSDGWHRMRCELWFLGYRPLKFESSFQIIAANSTLLPANPQLSETALAVLNQYRQVLKLTPLASQKQLTQAAEGHALYISQHYPQQINGEIHRESKEKAGFTGQNVGERAAYFGYFGYTGETIDPGGAFTPAEGVHGLIDSPYHRLLLLNPNFNECGIGFGERDGNKNIEVIVSGTLTEPADERVVLYPYAGQKNAKLGWMANEVPNPLRFFGVNDEFVGYPITISVHSDAIQELTTTEASLLDQNDQVVPTYRIDSTLDKSRNHLFLIPKQPLEFAQEYQVKASGKIIYKNGSSKPWQEKWKFQTLTQPDIETMTIERTQYDSSHSVDLLRVGLTCGDLPDMTYELRRQDQKVQKWDSRTRKFQFYDFNLADGKYLLVVETKGLSRTFPIEVYTVDGVKQVRKEESSGV